MSYLKREIPKRRRVFNFKLFRAMKVFITGGSGMVGRNVVEYLINKSRGIISNIQGNQFIDKEALAIFIQKKELRNGHSLCRSSGWNTS